VRKQEERKDVGQALSPDQERRLLDAAGKKLRWQLAATIIRVALLTGMRSGEIIRLIWGRIDFEKRIITVGKAKSTAGTGRQIPMNGDLFLVLSMHAEWFTKKFSQTKPEHYLFPWGKPQPTDPTRPTTTMKTAWGSIRDEAKVTCRLHDLRHTAATKMGGGGRSREHHACAPGSHEPGDAGAILPHPHGGQTDGRGGAQPQSQTRGESDRVG
jgi:integrase